VAVTRLGHAIGPYLERVARDTEEALHAARSLATAANGHGGDAAKPRSKPSPVAVNRPTLATSIGEIGAEVLRPWPAHFVD
jgi:hypothetical protein